MSIVVDFSLQVLPPDWSFPVVAELSIGRKEGLWILDLMVRRIFIYFTDCEQSAEGD